MYTYVSTNVYVSLPFEKQSPFSPIDPSQVPANLENPAQREEEDEKVRIEKARVAFKSVASSPTPFAIFPLER